MASKTAQRRLAKEHQMMEKDPPVLCYARPLESDMLTWHFILRGPSDTPYHGGEYWGQLGFPNTFPFSPPTIKMHTPSGRFKENEAICTSFSSFHPGSFNPSWSVSNILVGLLSLWTSEEMTTGGISATSKVRQDFASRSHGWNCTQTQFKKVFPEYAADKEKPRDLPNMGEKGSSSDLKASSQDSGKTNNISSPPSIANNSISAPAPTDPTTSPDSSSAAARAAQQGQQPPPPGEAPTPLLSTRNKVALVFALVAWLFVGRLMQRSSA